MARGTTQIYTTKIIESLCMAVWEHICVAMPFVMLQGTELKLGRGEGTGQGG